MKSILLGLTLCLVNVAAHAAEDMPLATNLYEDGQQALAKNIPIAILIDFRGLKSSDVLKEEAIYPNLLSGVFDNHVIFREIQVNVDGQIIDFYNEPLANAEFQHLFNVTSLPALVFVNGEGEQINPPLFSGAYEYYGFYLKRELDKAMAVLGNPTRFSE